MKKMSKNLLAFLLVLMMAMPLFSAAAFGADGDQEETPVLVRFDIPEGWTSLLDIDSLAAGDVASLSKDDAIIDVDIYIFCVDVYGNADNSTIEREEINNDWFSVEEISEMYTSVNLTDYLTQNLAGEPSTVTMKTFGGKEYYVISYEQLANQCYTALRYENGIKYEFKLSGYLLSESDKEHFEKFMGTVRYGDKKSFLGGEMLLVGGAALAVIVVVVLVVVLCSVRRKKKVGKSKAAEQTISVAEQPAATPSESAPATEFACPVCGGVLHTGDPVCSGCGVPLAW